MLKNLLAKQKESEVLREEIEKYHFRILKFGQRRQDILGKLEALKAQRTEELINAEDDSVFVNSKVKKQIFELQSELAEIESIAREVLLRKRAAIMTYYQKAAKDAETEALQIRLRRDEIYNEKKKIEEEYTIRIAELEQKYRTEDWWFSSKKNEAEKLANCRIQDLFKAEKVNALRSKADVDPFLGALPWHWDAAVTQLEEKEMVEVKAFKKSNSLSDNRVVNCTKMIKIDERGIIAAIDVSGFSSPIVYKVAEGNTLLVGGCQ